MFQLLLVHVTISQQLQEITITLFWIQIQFYLTVGYLTSECFKLGRSLGNKMFRTQGVGDIK